MTKISLAPPDNFAPVFNVMNYGAKGDGVTDDTAAIQAGLTAATGATCYVPYTPNGYLCGALTLPPGTALIFAPGAKLVALASLAAPFLQAAQAVVHQGSQVLGGTFDMSAVTSASATHAIDFSGVTSCPNLRVAGNRIINAPVHGIQVGEATYTLQKKWVERNSVEGHGVVASGFGIYCDYVGSVEVDRNYVSNTNGYDCIELGHSGPSWLTIDAHLRCTNNTVEGGAIQFPFSDYADILDNTVGANAVAGVGGIQNDANNANYVTISGNKVMAAQPAAGYAGISVYGSNATITRNKVFVTTGNGIQGHNGMVGYVVSNNYVYSSAGAATGNALYDGGSGSSSVISDNVLDGISGKGFLYALNLAGNGYTVKGNTVTSGCFDGLECSNLANSTVSGNYFGTYNVPNPGGTATTSRVSDNHGINPVGLVTVPVPNSGQDVAAAYYDRIFTSLTATSATYAISGGPSGVPMVAGAGIFVPAGKTLTPTYSALTWAVEGL